MISTLLTKDAYHQAAEAVRPLLPAGIPLKLAVDRFHIRKDMTAWYAIRAEVDRAWVGGTLLQVQLHFDRRVRVQWSLGTQALTPTHAKRLERAMQALIPIRHALTLELEKRRPTTGTAPHAPLLERTDRPRRRSPR